jgi:hypothetical protein
MDGVSGVCNSLAFVGAWCKFAGTSHAVTLAL